MNKEEKKTTKSVEAEGKDIEGAIKKALGKLGAKRKDVEIEILTEENKGLFGMEGANPARVRVNLKKC